MDTLRGAFGSTEPGDAASTDDSQEWGADNTMVADASQPRDLPPAAIGQDERRMQVRAYNHWASLLGDRMFPQIEDLDPANLPDFGPCSVLLDFSAGIEDPAVRFLGDKLAMECGADGAINQLSDVPPRSLLSRITDHYMQILANQAPIGFEAEFVNQNGAAILYRGILLPYSSDDDTIDFIYGVINWKEIADQVTADELLLEIDQALDLAAAQELEDEPHRHHADQMTDWADSPAHESTEGFSAEAGSAETDLPDFDQYCLDDEEEDEDEDQSAGYSFASLADYIEAPAKKAIDLADFDIVSEEAPAFDNGHEFADISAPQDITAFDDLPETAGLYDCLAAARELAHTASTTEDRGRAALYAAVSRAYDFSLAALDAPEDYAELIAESGLAVQERAPMTPVVKLVFGHDYDKTRLTEYAAVLSHAHRIGLERGSLTRFLSEVEGGLKGVVKAERRLRREEAGKSVESEAAVRSALARKLRELEALTLQALEGAGPEFALVMIRRDEAGAVSVLGELPEDIGQLERAARKLVG
jgi:hypothetical protein